MESIIHSDSKSKKYHHHHAAASSPRGSAGGGNDKKHDVRQQSSNLPPALASRLHQLFNSVEKEFEALYLENNQLRQRVNLLEKGMLTQCEIEDKTVGGSGAGDHEGAVGGGACADESLDKAAAASRAAVLKSLAKTAKMNPHKNQVVKTRQKILKGGANYTSKIVSSFKGASGGSSALPLMTSALVKEYIGHKDGLWDVSLSRLGHPLLATASADKTARVWGVDSGKLLTLYAGHTGSVNGVSFNPSQDLCLSCSGDGTAHVWQASPSDPSLGGLIGGSSGDDSPAEGGGDGGICEGYFTTVRHPISTLAGHHGVVISCQWLNECMAVTAGWDRQANLYNVETGGLLQSLVGHDSELTHVACHPTQRLVATSSTDSTFRLWDFREPIHSVSVFQGHTESVTCAVFSQSSDQIVSGSDDRSVKVWDLRNMRAPTTNIQTQSAVNRLDVSSSASGSMVAIPQDNRQVVVHDLSTGQKLTRLRGSGGGGGESGTKTHHRRMVSAVCWASSSSAALATGGGDLSSEAVVGSGGPPGSSEWRCRANLFSAGFDRKAFGWSVRSPSSSSKDDSKGGKDGGGTL